jgi:Cu/Ag efflux protein CusF
MKNLRRFPWLVATTLAWLAVALGAACSAPVEDHSGAGIIRAIDTESRQLTIEHGDISGLMKAMTMSFTAAQGVPIDDLEVGDPIEFRVKEEGGVYIVDQIERGSSS